MKSIFWIIVGLALSAARVVGQIPEGWEIKEIFPAGTEYYCGSVDINDRGQIVFHCSPWPNRSKTEVLLYDRGKLTQLTDDDVYDTFPHLNNRGDIVWQRDFNPDPGTENIGIVGWRDWKMEPISAEAFPQGSVDINDTGQMVWIAFTEPKIEKTQIVFYDGATIQQITDDQFVNQSPRINNHGDFVFERDNFFVDPFVFDIIGHFAGKLLTLTDAPDRSSTPDINDWRDVIWRVFSNSDYTTSLWYWNEGKGSKVVDGNVLTAHINNRNDICFSRWDSQNENPALWLLRASGELLQLADGSFGGNVSAINRRGEIAFQHGHFPKNGIVLLTKPEFVADLDFDGDVDLADFAILQNCFGESLTGIAEACSSSDINNDTVVDFSDVTRFVPFVGGPEFFEEPFRTQIGSTHMERNTVGKLALGAALAVSGMGTTALAQGCPVETANSWQGEALLPYWSLPANWDTAQQPSDCDNVFIDIPAFTVMDRPSAGVPRRRVLSLTVSQPGETNLGAAFGLNNSELYCVRDLKRTNSMDDHVMQLGEIDQIFVGDPLANPAGHGATYGFQWFIDGGTSGASVYVTDTIGCGRWTAADARIFVGFKPPSAGGQIIPTALGTIDPALCDTPAPEGGRI
ncbi:MAG: hypothetical protein AABZ47_04045, partial [Planctomycetota bacterium]